MPLPAALPVTAMTVMPVTVMPVTVMPVNRRSRCRQP
jgi:hypothetical protein